MSQNIYPYDVVLSKPTVYCSATLLCKRKWLKIQLHLKQNSETTSKDTATSEIDYCFLRRWYPYHAIEGKILHVSVSNRSLIMEMLNFLGLN